MAAEHLRVLAILADNWGLVPAFTWWLTIVPGDPVLSSDLFGYQAHTWYIYIHIGNTHTF